MKQPAEIPTPTTIRNSRGMRPFRSANPVDVRPAPTDENSSIRRPRKTGAGGLCPSNRQSGLQNTQRKATTQLKGQAGLSGRFRGDISAPTPEMRDIYRIS